MILSFVGVVVIFGVVMILVNYQSVEREKENTTKMYEERGLAIAAALDSSVTGDQQLRVYAQTMVNKVTYVNNIGITAFTIHGKALEGSSDTGYWIIGSSASELIHTPSTLDDLNALQQNAPNITYTTENDKKFVNISYPLHDVSGNAIGTASIKLDMSLVDKIVIPSTTYVYIILMVVVALLAATFLAYSITKPIKQLTEVANQVSTGSLDTKMPEIKSKDEIGDLSKSLGRMVASIKFMMTDKEG
jgi:HAMP domain-containing protein